MQEDEAEIKNALNLVTRAQHELSRYQAQYKALHLQYTRLNGVFESQPGIVAQQEVDDSQGKDLAASSQVDAGQAALEAAQSQLAVAKAKFSRDQSLFDYSKITAPFTGIVTERYANLGTLVQAGTSSQAAPIGHHDKAQANQRCAAAIDGPSDLSGHKTTRQDIDALKEPNGPH